MQIKFNILFFGATSSAAGLRNVEKGAPRGIDAARLLDQIKEEYPKLSNYKLLISINQNYASGDEVINDGDEIAIFTPVSGG